MVQEVQNKTGEPPSNLIIICTLVSKFQSFVKANHPELVVDAQIVEGTLVCAAELAKYGFTIIRLSSQEDADSSATTMRVLLQDAKLVQSDPQDNQGFNPSRAIQYDYQGDPESDASINKSNELLDILNCSLFITGIPITLPFPTSSAKSAPGRSSVCISCHPWNRIRSPRLAS